ncbi:hypothetical protein [Bacillus mycoides]|uniref:hypothetical protein n=1 Tax=Bacillus mycoides TaxID=1405 RepID=UPI003D1B4612
MGRSKPMRDAYYRGYANPDPHKQEKVNCHDVTIEMKNKGTFHCMDCERQVVYAGGKNPYYRLPSKDAEHDVNCDNYLPVDEVSERIRTIGEKLKIKLKLPFFHEKEEENKVIAGVKVGKLVSTGVNPVKVGPIKTIKSPNKSTTVTLNSAADLLYHTSDNRPDEHRMNVWRVLRSNKQYYYPGTFDELKRDFEDGKLNPMVFVRGRLNQNQFFTFEKHGYIDIQDKPYKYGPVELRLHFKGVPELEKRFKNLTWYIRSGKNRTEEIGIMGNIIEVEKIENKTYIHIRCYDLDVEPKDVG